MLIPFFHQTLSLWFCCPTFWLLQPALLWPWEAWEVSVFLQTRVRGHRGDFVLGWEWGSVPGRMVKITYLPEKQRGRSPQGEGAAHLGVCLTSLKPWGLPQEFLPCASIEEAHSMSRGHGWGMASCVSSGESWVCLVFVTCGNSTEIWRVFGNITRHHGWVWLSLSGDLWRNWAFYEKLLGSCFWYPGLLILVMCHWMASPTQWTWVWASSRSWWWTGKPGMLQSMGLQRAGHDWVTELTQAPPHFIFSSGESQSTQWLSG